MTCIVFYEKPGCGGNARQRAALEAAGHTLLRRNLLTEPWTHETLLQYLAPLPVPDWFNRAAPRIKRAEVQPHTLTHEAALKLLLAEPLLIRRPLMQRTDNRSCFVGFDTKAVNDWVGLGTNPASMVSLEGCASPTERCSVPLTHQGDHHADV